jgi:hypothetical protein
LDARARTGRRFPDTGQIANRSRSRRLAAGKRVTKGPTPAVDDRHICRGYDPASTTATPTASSLPAASALGGLPTAALLLSSARLSEYSR